jgi:hypothetical protein
MHKGKGYHLFNRIAAYLGTKLILAHGGLDNEYCSPAQIIKSTTPPGCEKQVDADR